jgi:hypothetical protein
MHIILILLLVLAAVCFAGAAAGAAFGRLNLIGLGLLFFVLTLLIPELTAK